MITFFFHPASTPVICCYLSCGKFKPVLFIQFLSILFLCDSALKIGVWEGCYFCLNVQVVSVHKWKQKEAKLGKEVRQARILSGFPLFIFL